MNTLTFFINFSRSERTDRYSLVLSVNKRTESKRWIFALGVLTVNQGITDTFVTFVS